jgi:hypothetical protein
VAVRQRDRLDSDAVGESSESGSLCGARRRLGHGHQSENQCDDPARHYQC